MSMRILETGINMFLLEVKSAFPFDGRFGNIYQNIYIRASLVAQMIKHPPAIQKTWVGKMLWRRKWQPTPVFLPGEFHGQRSLAGYSPWVRKESDMTERLTHTSI